MTVAWTTTELVGRALGPAVTTDGYLTDCVAAANAWAHRKRREAGYDDPDAPAPEPPSPAPSPDVAMGTTLYAVALWRERASTDGYASFEELGGFAPTGGSLGQIRRLLGIGRAAVDAPLTVTGPGGVVYRARRWRR